MIGFNCSNFKNMSNTYMRSLHGVVVKLLETRGREFGPGFSSLLDETLNRGPVSV